MANPRVVLSLDLSYEQRKRLREIRNEAPKRKLPVEASGLAGPSNYGRSMGYDGVDELQYHMGLVKRRGL